MTGRTIKRKANHLLVQFVGGFAVGGLGALLLIRFGPDLEAPGMHAPGLLVAALLAIVGVAILGTSLSRAGAARLAGAELEPDDDISSELRSLRWQGLVTLLAGIELMILSLPVDLLTGSRPAVLLALAVTLAAQTWFNIVLWRQGDELFRRIIVEACVIGFIALQLVLFFWAAGARLTLLADPGALDIYVVMMVLYLAGSGIAGVRRGYATPV